MSIIVLRDDWAEYRGAHFWAANNVWNKGNLINGVNYTQTISVNTGTFPTGTTLTWVWPGNFKPSIYSYPEVLLGYKPWNNYGSLGFTSKINDLKDFKINYSLTLAGQTNNFNIAFSLWLTDRAQGRPEDINTELMIWIHDGALNPAGSPVGQYDGRTFDATVYFSPNHGDASGGSAVTWQYIALEASTDVLSGQIDVRHILLDLRKKGLLTGQEFVSGYELGAEVAAGSGSFKINSLTQTFSRFVATTGPDNIVGTIDDDRISGGAANDLLKGSSGNDILSGGTGNDLLTGGAGNDWLDGGAGSDNMRGGAGNDNYIVDHTNDIVNEDLSGSGGIDTVRSKVSFNLAYAARAIGAVENLYLQGTAPIYGTGNGLANVINGNIAANVLIGSAGNDILNGGGGNDTLYGGAGNDRLTGGGGNDYFVFNSYVAGIDTITDFNVAADTIRLDNAPMPGLGAALGTLSAAKFWKSTTGLAHDRDDRIVYETDTGKLFYDSNGNAAGGATHFATLSPNLALTNADFQVI